MDAQHERFLEIARGMLAADGVEPQEPEYRTKLYAQAFVVMECWRLGEADERARGSAELAAIASGIAAGFARATRGISEPTGGRIAPHATLILRHEWIDQNGHPLCPECHIQKPEHAKACGWGNLCERLRYPLVTGFINDIDMNFIMGARAEAGAIVTFNDSGHLVPREGR